MTEQEKRDIVIHWARELATKVQRTGKTWWLLGHPYHGTQVLSYPDPAERDHHVLQLIEAVEDMDGTK